MAGSYYLDKNRNSGKKVIAANAGLTPEDNLGPYIKYTIDGTEHTISWDEAVEKQYIIVDQFIYGGRNFSIHPGTENNPLKRAMDFLVVMIWKKSLFQIRFKKFLQVH